MALGLYALHRQNYVHRDLKLENVMFVSNDSYDCKLIDFGFAEKINREVLLSKAGTPGFLPPELFKMAPYVDRGDIFSLGIILYCMVSGQSPFKGKTYKEVLENNKKCVIEYNTPAWQNVSNECIELIKNMVNIHPSQRHTAKDVLKSPFIQKYYIFNANDDVISMRSFKSNRSIQSRGRKRDKSHASVKKKNYFPDSPYSETLL